MNYFTADSHFSRFDETVLSRDFRPFSTLEEMNEKQRSLTILTITNMKRRLLQERDNTQNETI